MAGSHQDQKGYRHGDKVRVRVGPHKGRRGVIVSETDGVLSVDLGEKEAVRVVPDEVTNYSLAARRAWETMPKKAGRPRLSPSGEKKMVSLRIDADVWESLGKAVDFGLVPNRQHAVNTWLRERLDSLFGEDTAAQHTRRPHDADGGEGNGCATN